MHFVVQSSMYLKTNVFLRVAVHLILLNCALKLSVSADIKNGGILFHDRVIYEMSVGGNWQRAFTECRAKGLDLLTINSLGELASINAIVDSSMSIVDKVIWTSGRFLPSLNAFYWITTGKIITEFQLEGYNYACLSIRYGTPQATNCNDWRVYFCEERIPDCKGNLLGKKAILCYGFAVCQGNQFMEHY